MTKNLPFFLNMRIFGESQTASLGWSEDFTGNVIIQEAKIGVIDVKEEEIKARLVGMTCGEVNILVVKLCLFVPFLSRRCYK